MSLRLTKPEKEKGNWSPFLRLLFLVLFLTHFSNFFFLFNATLVVLVCYVAVHNVRIKFWYRCFLKHQHKLVRQFFTNVKVKGLIHSSSINNPFVGSFLYIRTHIHTYIQLYASLSFTSAFYADTNI